MGSCESLEFYPPWSRELGTVDLVGWIHVTLHKEIQTVQKSEYQQNPSCFGDFQNQVRIRRQESGSESGCSQRLGDHTKSGIATGKICVVAQTTPGATPGVK